MRYLYPRHARPSLTSCPTPIGHLRLPVKRLPVKPAMTIWCHALPFSPSCPTPIGHLQIAGQEITGQAGNDEKALAMTIAKTITSTRSFSCPALPPLLSCPTPIGHRTPLCQITERIDAKLPKTIEYFVTFTILAIFANELKQNVLWQNQ